MPRWIKPSEETPDVEVGDRIVIIVAERARADGPIVPRLVILQATETGWYSDDPLYDGYSVHDGVLWSTEQDVCQIANVFETRGPVR